MPEFSKRTQRQRGGPDPVAACISSDLAACRVDDKDDSEHDATVDSATAGSARYTVNPKDADLSAGEEFVQALPNDDTATKP